MPIPPFYTHPLSHMIPGRSSLINLFSSPFSVFAVCARTGTGQYELLHSDFIGWIFGELMDILFCTLERVKFGVGQTLNLPERSNSENYGRWNNSQCYYKVVMCL